MPPFSKLLIANRGEIAVRIIRACRDLGIGTVAVYAEPDRQARHVQLADEAYALGAGTLGETYLAGNKLIVIAQQAGAQAIHPGFGFLSENADFAAACAEAGLAFVGPTPEVIRRMGSKVVARQTMQAAGVPVVPGTFTAVKDAREVADFAAQYGYPVALKASAGGGGKGFRVVRSAEEIEAALTTATREGLSYFGDATVYLEKYLPTPRHIEVQILGDHHGHVIHLGERDCSLQRRHQKILEEAPAMHLPTRIRDELLAAAVRGAKAIGYRGAGTFEFIVQGDEFYFLEVNTRIQVEHGITELITGVDIVSWMIRIATGEPLAIRQDDVQPKGHALEVRINAEAVDRNFAPAPGRITRYQEPSGPWVRVDSAAYEGWDIPTQYDSMVAKLMTWGHDRAEAIARMQRALAEYDVQGVPTTIPLHRWLLTQADIVAGQYDTGYLARHFQSGTLAPSTPAEPASGEALVRREMQVEVNARLFTVTVFEPETAGTVPVAAGAGKPKRQGGGQSQRQLDTNELAAPLSGTVVQLKVAVGDAIEAGQAVAVIEAMKMENDIAALKGGRVTAVHVKVGDPVSSGAPLLTVE
jgi:acetyl-CoA/propionyl-CoA carboxylase biotin carboxyl carrier protein